MDGRREESEGNGTEVVGWGTLFSTVLLLGLRLGAEVGNRW
jgi:hypothetical protein